MPAGIGQMQLCSSIKAAPLGSQITCSALTCNWCSNPTPPEYRENTGPDGRRRDADVRPELSKGSVEFLASSPVYAVRFEPTL